MGALPERSIETPQGRQTQLGTAGHAPPWAVPRRLLGRSHQAETNHKQNAKQRGRDRTQQQRPVSSGVHADEHVEQLSHAVTSLLQPHGAHEWDRRGAQRKQLGGELAKCHDATRGHHPSEH